MGAMKRVAGYEMESMDGEIAEKHAAIPAKRNPAIKSRGRARMIPVGEARCKSIRIMLIETAEINPRVAPHNITPRIT